MLFACDRERCSELERQAMRATFAAAQPGPVLPAGLIVVQQALPATVIIHRSVECDAPQTEWHGDPVGPR